MTCLQSSLCLHSILPTLVSRTTDPSASLNLAILPSNPNCDQSGFYFLFHFFQVPAWGLEMSLAPARPGAVLALLLVSHSTQSCWGFCYPIHSADTPFFSHSHPLWSGPGPTMTQHLLSEFPFLSH